MPLLKVPIKSLKKEGYVLVVVVVVVADVRPSLWHDFESGAGVVGGGRWRVSGDPGCARTDVRATAGLRTPLFQLRRESLYSQVLAPVFKIFGEKSWQKFRVVRVRAARSARDKGWRTGDKEHKGREEQSPGLPPHTVPPRRSASPYGTPGRRLSPSPVAYCSCS